MSRPDVSDSVAPAPARPGTGRVTLSNDRQRGSQMLSWIVGVPFWAGVVVGVLVTLILTAIF